jgi:hypothetical protein
MKEYQERVKQTKKNIELTQKMLKEIEEKEQAKLKNKVLENTDN